MRTYHIFNIKPVLYKIYTNKEYVLYNILEELYKMNKKDIVFCYKFFSEIANTFNKNNLNTYIYNEQKEHITYMKNINTHIINDVFRNESTYLTIYNSHIKIKTNNDLTEFFKLLNNKYPYLFVCDFVTYDYFWLNTCINNKNLVKCS